ncbi:MAG: hypothetical protein KA371_20795 [Acidobacteria bacterium]|nr:hypothetical protein [Acidobacteriota bacterium]
MAEPPDRVVKVPDATSTNALDAGGLTPRQVRFLMTVMLHSGVFVGRQYAAFAGITHGQKVHNFIKTLLARRFVTPLALGTTGRARIFHVHHKPLYAAIGEQDNRLRRRVTIERAVERLMVLDGVLADGTVTWLGAERDKRRYFQARFGNRLRDDEYPRLVFGRAHNVTVRYFPDKLPIGYDADRYQHVFLYLARSPSPADFRVFLLRHQELLNALDFWTIRVLFPRSLARFMDGFERAAHETLARPLTPDTVTELLWLFEHSRSDGPAVPAVDPVRLQAARTAFRRPRFTALRRRWLEDGARSVFVATSPVARDALERGRGRVECVELPHNYDYLRALGRLRPPRDGREGG